MQFSEEVKMRSWIAYCLSDNSQVRSIPKSTKIKLSATMTLYKDKTLLKISGNRYGSGCWAVFSRKLRRDIELNEGHVFRVNSVERGFLVVVHEDDIMPALASRINVAPNSAQVESIQCSNYSDSESPYQIPTCDQTIELLSQFSTVILPLN